MPERRNPRWPDAGGPRRARHALSGAPKLLAIAALAAAARAQAPEPGERCRACHAIQVDGYRAGGMARALGPLAPGELGRVTPSRERSGPYSYRFETDGPGPRVVESYWSRDGEREVARDVDAAPVLFAIGAGIVDRSYAVRRGDLMRLGPLEVLTGAVGTSPRAQLAPGHSIQPGSRWTITVAEECLRCHASSLPPRDHPYDLVPPESWRPSGIDCDACHARAAPHADWQAAAAGGDAPAGADPIASDAGPRRTGFDSCARCHLQGDSLLSIGEPWRGIPPPEADLFERRAAFVPAQPDGEIGFVSHVERLALSSCFLATRDRATGMLLCTTCHDPHRSSTDAVERARVRNACAKCHDAGGGEAGGGHGCALPASERGERGCVDCHMRRTGVHDVAGVEIHDHRIERRPPPASARGPLRVKSARDGRIARFLASGERSTDRSRDPGLWLMALVDAGRRDLAWELAAAEPGATADALPGFHHLRASLREEHRDLAGAESDLRRALALDPDHSESSVNLGALLAGSRRAREAVEVLTRQIERHPRSEGALRNRAVAFLGLGRLDDAARDFEAAWRVYPQAPVARILAQVHQRQGRSAEAERWTLAAKALDPAAR